MNVITPRIFEIFNTDVDVILCCIHVMKEKRVIPLLEPAHHR